MDELGKTEATLIAARREHLAALRSRGRDPFAQRRCEVDATASELQARYGFLVAGQDASAEGWSLAGRLLSKRTMGKSVFSDLADRTGRLQIYVKKNDVGDEAFEDWEALDRGDLIAVRGYMFRSKMGELTLHVTAFTAIGKSLRPLPDKWHGLQDVEKRYRQRYVDFIVNPDARDVLIMRSKIIAQARRFIDDRGFYEVETPTLLHVAGGAAARPFVTHCNALDQLMQMRIATELNLKRLIVAGMERVYEIGRIFRNEGIDTTHNPEFTMLELYAAYWDVYDMLEFNEALVAHLVSVVTEGGDELPHPDGKGTISFARPFARVEYLEAMDRWSEGRCTRERLLDPNGARDILRELGLPESPSHGHALDKIFERIVEPHLEAPTFVMGYPVAISPLAKRREGDPDITDRYELFCAQMEISNAFTEL
ncbi:MAG TPA: lysine--tRNA ligase, partial [Candidatus Cybelea sp.]|nr:lysine--tRNA ligase [Candidatus Cybelea sp.]